VNESKWISISIYNTIAVLFVLLSFFASLNVNDEGVFWLAGCSTLFLTTVITIALFVPKYFEAVPEFTSQTSTNGPRRNSATDQPPPSPRKDDSCEKSRVKSDVSLAGRSRSSKMVQLLCFVLISYVLFLFLLFVHDLISSLTGSRITVQETFFGSHKYQYDITPPQHLLHNRACPSRPCRRRSNHLHRSLRTALLHRSFPFSGCRGTCEPVPFALPRTQFLLHCRRADSSRSSFITSDSRFFCSDCKLYSLLCTCC
jgi:hypothetical protein